MISAAKMQLLLRAYLDERGSLVSVRLSVCLYVCLCANWTHKFHQVSV